MGLEVFRSVLEKFFNGLWIGLEDFLIIRRVSKGIGWVENFEGLGSVQKGFIRFGKGLEGG